MSAIRDAFGAELTLLSSQQLPFLSSSTCETSIIPLWRRFTALTTPLRPHSHLQALLFVYVGAVPLQLVRTLGIWCVPATAIACAVFYGVDRAAEELSDPFGTERESLRSAWSYCCTIERRFNGGV